MCSVVAPSTKRSNFLYVRVETTGKPAPEGPVFILYHTQRSDHAHIQFVIALSGSIKA